MTRIRSALPGIRAAGDACKVYACDALLLEIINNFDNVWVASDAAGSSTLAPSKGSAVLNAFGTPNLERPAVLADNCGETSTEISSNEYWRNTSASFITSISGSMGGIVRSTSRASMRFLESEPHGANICSIGLSMTSGENLDLAVNANGVSEIVETYVGAWPTGTSAHFLVNYQLTSTGEYSVELFRDFVSLGLRTGSTGGTFEVTSPRLLFGGAGTSGVLDIGYISYANSIMSSGQIAALKDALDQNAASYVDPDPLCGINPPPPNEDPIPERFALVWNFEDNNFTWMDASVIDAQELIPCVSMNYGLEPGWQTTWQSLQDKGIIWGVDGDTGPDNLMAGTDHWGDGEGPTGWDDFYYAGKEQNMFWLTELGVSESDQVLDKSGVKSYFAERVAMDFDDVLGSTSNSYKHVRQLFPLLESPESGPMNTYGFSIGWAANLMDGPDYNPQRTIYLNKSEYSGKHKIDTRSTGRYMAMKWDFTYTDEIAMTGVDIDIEDSHGR